MLTWNADDQFAIIGCAQLRELRALAPDTLPSSTGPWTEALECNRIDASFGLYEFVSRRLAGRALFAGFVMSIWTPGRSCALPRPDQHR